MEPGLSPDEVRTAMQNTSVDIGSNGYDIETGFGKINAFNAVSMFSQPVVNIDFDVSHKGKIKLSIYDLRGRLVQTIIDNRIYEAGSYNIKWFAENYASGIYLVKFESTDNRIVKKVTLLK